MGRTDQHKMLKQRKRDTLERAFFYAAHTGVELARWLNLHSAIREEDAIELQNLFAEVDIVVQDIGQLFYKAYGFYTPTMSQILGMDRQEENDHEDD